MEKTPPSRKVPWPQNRFLWAIVVIFLVGSIAITFIQFLLPAKRDAQVSVENVGRPIADISEVGNGSTWASLPNYVLSPSLDSEMANDEGNLYAAEIYLENGFYQMWYGAQSRDGHDAIHYATSEDGVSWKKYGVVIETGTNNHVNDPTVVKVNGTFYMYYSVAPTDELDQVWTATSTDGMAWTIHGSALIASTNQADWDSLKVGRPTVLYREGEFQMWFDGSQRSADDATQVQPGSGRHVGYATSIDGLTWIKWVQNPIVLNSGAIDVDILNNTFIMLEESATGIFWRTGTNETTFQPSASLLFNATGTGFDPYGHVTPFILIENGKWIAVYTGAATVQTWNRNRIAVWYPFYNVSLIVNDPETGTWTIIKHWSTSKSVLYWTIPAVYLSNIYKLQYWLRDILKSEIEGTVSETPTTYLFVPDTWQFKTMIAAE